MDTSNRFGPTSSKKYIEDFTRLPVQDHATRVTVAPAQINPAKHSPSVAHAHITSTFVFPVVVGRTTDAVKRAG